MNPALSVENIVFSYRSRASWFIRKPAPRAIDDVSFEVGPGRCAGIIGESGSGKSSLARLIAGVYQPDSGRISFQVQDSTKKTPHSLKRRMVQLVFQDPNSSLDPSWDVWECVAETLLIDGIKGRLARTRAIAALDRVGLVADLAERKPHQLSGGQRQRVAIARALIAEPDILVLDEPTSALDLTVQAGVLNLLLDIQNSLGLTCLFISHDIDVIRHMSQQVFVMRDGRLLESGPASEVLSKPRHAYTQALIDAAPALPGALR